VGVPDGDARDNNSASLAISIGIMPSAPSAAAVEIVRRSQTASPSPLARNPVSLRLYKVLGATFEDEATREALSTLSDLYAPSGSPAVVSNAKEDTIVLDGVDEVDMESVKDVPSFLRGAPPGDTAAKARKHLRRDIESKMEEGSLRFLAAFSVVDQVRITSILFDVHAAHLAHPEIGRITSPHNGHAGPVRRGTEPASIDERGM
jgi:hypothetical protein